MKGRTLLVPATLVAFLLLTCSNGFCQAFPRDTLYILNAPSTASEGDDSILALGPSGTASFLVAPDPNLNGMREIAFDEGETTLYAMQSHYSLGVHRILLVNSTGAITDQIVGFDGTLRAMTRNTDGLLYVIVSEFPPSSVTKIVKVDPESHSIASFSNFGSAYFIGDMDHDASGNLYFTGWGGGVYNAIFKVNTLGELSTFADSGDGLDTPFGLTYDSEAAKIWVANSRPTITAQLYSFTLAGVGSYYADIGDLGQPNVRGLLIDADGVPMATLGEYDRVVKVAQDGSLTDVATAADGVHWPVDLKSTSPASTPPRWGGAVDSADAAVYGAETARRSSTLNICAVVLIPLGTVVLFGFLRKKT